jgi:hypothetical protein
MIKGQMLYTGLPEEILNNPFDRDKEIIEKNDYEYILRKCNIYKICGGNNVGVVDDRIQVRPIPEFANVTVQEELDNLPKYPPLRQGEVITGHDEVTDGGGADQVMVMCTRDFSIGYVICKVNTFGAVEETEYPWSYSYDSVKEYLNARRALPSDFDYNHLDVIRWVTSQNGGGILLMNNRTGDLTYMNSSGTCMTIQQELIYFRVGTPSNPVDAGPTAFSALTMTPDTFSIKTDKFVLDAKDKTFGNHGVDIAAAPSVVPLTGTNGVTMQQVNDIHL